MPAFKDLTGQTFGRLKVIRGERRRGLWWWMCRCSCGNNKWIIGGNITRRGGGTKSCGCIAKDRARERGALTHGHAVGGARSPTLSVWENMIRRCCNPKDKSYKHYGGRGIKVCDRWRASFENFLSDMGERPAGLSIDRIDNDGDYEPDNCRWATKTQQGRNTRANVLVEHNGKAVPISEFAEIVGVPYNTAFAWVKGVSKAREVKVIGKRTEHEHRQQQRRQHG